MKLEGIEATREERRFYPDHEMAAQVLGSRALITRDLNGLENYYNKNPDR